MFEQIKEKFAVEKSLFYVIIITILIVFGVVFYLFFGYVLKKVTLVFPNEGAELELGKEYEIKWTSRGVEKIGIALFNGEKPEWIAQNINAKAGSYKWVINSDHEYGSDFWIAVFDYPWRKGSSINYSSGPIKITYPELLDCDKLSLENEWPYLTSNTPNLRKLFITKETYNGNLGGLEGADKKCQESAEKLGFEGKWSAFLGGDNDEDTAINRLEKTSRKKDGFFVEAVPASELLNGLTCHRLLGNNLDEFLTKLSGSKLINNEKLDKEFLSSLPDIWLGRINNTSKRNCISVESSSYASTKEKYSFSSTCQNWTQSSRIVPGYSDGVKLNSSFPSCYTPKGEFTYSLGLGALGIDLVEYKNGAFYSTSVAKYCDSAQRLICIED